MLMSKLPNDILYGIKKYVSPFLLDVLDLVIRHSVAII